MDEAHRTGHRDRGDQRARHHLASRARTWATIWTKVRISNGVCKSGVLRRAKDSATDGEAGSPVITAGMDLKSAPIEASWGAPKPLKLHRNG